LFGSGNATDVGMTAGTFNKIVTLTSPYAGVAFNEFTQLTFNGTTIAEARTVLDATYVYINYDFTELTGTVTAVALVDASGDALMDAETETFAASSVGTAAMARLTTDANAKATAIVETDTLHMNFTTTNADPLVGETGDSFFIDIFSFGDRTNNAIYRMLLEESDDNTGIFEGDVEFIMLNQLNVDTVTVFESITPVSDSLTIIVHEDMTDEDSPRINYLDLGSDGVETQIADQVAAPSHSGVVTFDSENYKTADTVVVTLDDQDLNTDSELIDVYVTHATDDKVGNNGSDHIMDITFDDSTWTALYEQGFTLVETGVDSGIFVGSFQIPSGQTGKDIEVNYNDHRDASGETIEVGDGAAVNANTGTVAFDRTVYPVPWGNETAGEKFSFHSTAIENTAYPAAKGGLKLAQGNVTVHVSVTDADYDVSAFGQDSIADTTVVLKIERGSSETTVATFGNSANPIYETSPSSGVFEYDATIGYRSGPDTAADACPSTFSTGCVLQGDIITATYTDKTDASGTKPNCY